MQDTTQIGLDEALELKPLEFAAAVTRIIGWESAMDLHMANEFEDFLQEVRLAACRRARSGQARAPSAMSVDGLVLAALHRHRESNLPIALAAAALKAVQEDGLASSQYDPSERLVNMQALAEALNATARLPARCRQAFSLKVLEGLSNSQISHRMHVSVKAVEQHIRSARAACLTASYFG